MCHIIISDILEGGYIKGRVLFVKTAYSLKEPVEFKINCLPKLLQLKKHTKQYVKDLGVCDSAQSIMYI